mmetsp:Transcript_2249/g.2444  ORF Transcript_2249/g.2444 Transcript_2249/m.2444 type:complete len:167 (-) Transcript_2249:43-543(-)
MSDLSSDEAVSDEIENQAQIGGEEKAQGKDDKEQRAGKQYKVFVGNMPYSANDDSVKHFFKCVKDELVSIRLLTDKESGQSRGCAFVEFTTSEAMQKALAMTGSELNGRKLRIEPSAAGGGKSAKRVNRINRNKKLVEREIKKRRKVWATKKKSDNEAASQSTSQT